MFDFLWKWLKGGEGSPSQKQTPSLPSGAMTFVSQQIGERDPLFKLKTAGPQAMPEGLAVPVDAVPLAPPVAPASDEPVPQASVIVEPQPTISIVPQADIIPATPESIIPEPPSIASVVSDDTRVGINPPLEDMWFNIGGKPTKIKAPAAPWSAICLLQLHFGADTFRGTGWLIGPKTIITAAHNLHIRKEGRNVDSITVFPAKTGQGDGPFATRETSHYAFDQRFMLPTSDLEAGRFDYGAIFLLEKPLALLPDKYFRFEELDPATNIGPIQVAGYPIDKKDDERPLVLAGGKLREPTNNKSKDPLILIHDVDTIEGESGGPIYYYSAGKYTAIGIHTDGIGFDAKLNAGRRITPDLAKKMSEWVKNPGKKIDANILVA